MAREVIKIEGIPVGISSGAAIYTALKLAADPVYKNKKIVVLIASSTERYLSTLLAEEERKIALTLPTETVSDEWLSQVING